MESITLRQGVPDAFAGDPVSRTSDVWGCDVTFRKGEYYLVEAASGTGKSSLCSYLYGFRTDYAGRILLGGEDCRTFSAARWGDVRRRSLSLLFQDLRLFGELTVAENLALKNGLTAFKTPGQIERLLEAAGIAAKRDTPAGKLSFGQQQRVAIARAIVTRPKLLLADEPTGSLDSARSVEIMELLRELNREDGITVALVTHEPDMATYASRRIIFKDGHLVDDGRGGGA